MTARLDRIRAAIVDLDRAGLRKLAADANVSREAVEDFGVIGATLPSEAMAAVESWFSLWELRSMLSGPRSAPLVADLHENTGIPASRREAFMAGDDAALSPAEQAAARDYLTGKSRRPGPATKWGTANMPLINPLRALAMNEVRAMSEDQLAAFLAERGIATDKAA